MSSAPEIFKTSRFYPGDKIRMAGPWRGALLFIIAAAGILVCKKNGYRRARGITFEHTRFNKRKIGFFSWRCTFLHSPFPSFYIRLEICFTDLKSRGTTINDYSREFPVRFTDNGNPEYPADTIHASGTFSLKI